MKAKILIFILFLALSNVSQEQWQNFPEDFTSLDYLTYNSNEWFLGAYYITDPHSPSTGKKYDYRNGIVVYPFSDVRIILLSFNL